MTKEAVFLTGATGTVGSGILEILAAAGLDVHCLIRTSDAAPRIVAAGGQPVVGDMTDPSVFQRRARERPFNWVIHAAQAHHRDHSADEIHRQEAVAVEHLEYLRSAATRLMIFTGGVWIYGDCPDGRMIDESTPRDPRAAAAGRAALMAGLAGRRDSIWAQLCLPSLVYGSTGPLIDIADRFRAGDVDVGADESARWSVIERLDLGRAYLALLRHGRPGDYFVVAEDAPVGVVALHEAVARHLRQGRALRNARAGKAGNQPVDASRFKQRTDWRSQENFMTSFARFLPAPNLPRL